MAAEGQEAEIEAEVKAKPLVGPLETLDSLDEEYKTNPKFLRKIEDAKKKYKGLRRVRGDGSCFYRSYLFAYLEHLLTHPDEIAGFQQKLKESFDTLVALGTPQFTLEDFYEALSDEVKWIQKDKPAASELLEHINDPEISNYITYYCRQVVSGHLKSHAGDYEAFLPDGMSMASFIKAEVEPVKAEADYIQCAALTRALGIAVRIEYLDQSQGALNGHVLPAGLSPKVFLLYRPGHYDLLYPSSSSSSPSSSSSSSSSSSPSPSSSSSSSSSSTPSAATSTTATAASAAASSSSDK